MKFIFESNQIFEILSRRKAIRARCIDCSGFIKSEVRNCDHIDCVLHPFRSGRGKQNPAERDRAIRKYCLWCMNGQRNEVKLCPSVGCPLFHYRMTRKAIQRREKEYIGGSARQKKTPVMDIIPEVRR